MLVLFCFWCQCLFRFLFILIYLGKLYPNSHLQYKDRGKKRQRGRAGSTSQNLRSQLWKPSYIHRAETWVSRTKGSGEGKGPGRDHAGTLVGDAASGWFSGRTFSNALCTVLLGTGWGGAGQCSVAAGRAAKWAEVRGGLCPTGTPTGDCPPLGGQHGPPQPAGRAALAHAAAEGTSMGVSSPWRRQGDLQTVPSASPPPGSQHF